MQDEQGEVYHCLFRQNLGDIACGDQVAWERTGQQASDREGVVTALLERHSVLSRSNFAGDEKPLAANITQLVITLAPRPEPSEYLIDQYLIAAVRSEIDALILVNKADLLSADQREALQQRLACYAKIGYPLVYASAKMTHGLDELNDHLAGQTSILVGQSGVGKSSLTNALIPDLELQTQQLSDKRDVGQHTTSASTLYFLANGGRLIDSPGVRSFRLGQIDRQTLEAGFVEFAPYLGHCRFSNCSHTSEPGCALIKACEDGELAKSRLDNFCHMAANL